MNSLDRIVLGVAGADDIVAAHGDYVGGETLATSIVTDAKDARAVRTIDVGKRSVRISVAKDGRA